MYKALILDMDGTTIDSERMVAESLELLLAPYGVTLTPEQQRRSIGCASDTFLASLDLGEDLETLSLNWRNLMLEMMDGVGLYRGMDAVLAASIRRGVVTSQTRLELTSNFDRLGIGGLFECSVCADELPYQKPCPEPLLHCIRSMGLAAGDVLYVGDSPYDLRCARDADVDFGLAGWGADQHPDFSAARYVFQRPEDILPLISKAAG